MVRSKIIVEIVRAKVGDWVVIDREVDDCSAPSRATPSFLHTELITLYC